MKLFHYGFVLFTSFIVNVNAAPPMLETRLVPVRPSQDAFYAVPDGVDKLEPGAILSHRKPPSPIAAFRVSPVNLQDTHQILYRTTDSLGNATATVLTILVPHNADTSKVLSYQVAEDSANVDCAPSYAFQANSATGPLLGTIITQAELLLIEVALEEGWVVIVPDHYGPKSAFLANKLGGQATLDGIRAAINSSPFTGISKTPRVAMWGLSGGSLATGWAAELHATYAPELPIVGAAVGLTVPNITNVIASITKTYFAGLSAAGIMGLSAQYPELGAVIKKHLKPEYAAKFYHASQQCFPGAAAELLFQDVRDLFDDPNIFYTNPTAVWVLNEIALGKATPKIPLLWYKSIHDEVSPVEDSDALVNKYCNEGATIEYYREAASEHAIPAVTGAAKVITWLTRVLNGQGPSKGCSTKTVASLLLEKENFDVLPKALGKVLLDLLGKPVGPVPTM